MNCVLAQSLLSAYIDRELAGDQLLELRAHLYDCEGCHNEELELRSLKALLGEMRSPAPSCDFDAHFERVVGGACAPERNYRGSGIFVLYAGLAAASLAFTFYFLKEPVMQPVPRKNDATSRLAFEIDRDQAYAASMDPMGGSPLMSYSMYAK